MMKIFVRKNLLLAGMSLILMMGAPENSAAAEEEGYKVSLSTMVMFALDNNPDIEIFKRRYNQAYYAVKEQQSGYYPDVGLRLEGGRAYNKPGGGGRNSGSSVVNNTGAGAVTVTQMLFDGFETSNTVKQSKKVAEAASYAAQSTIEEVVGNTVEAYLQVWRYQNAVDSSQILVEDVTRNLNVIGELFEGGAIPKAIYDYAKSRQSVAETDLNTAISAYNNAISTLEFLVGKLPDDFVAELPDKFHPDKLDLQYYLDAVATENTEVLEQNRQIEALIHQLRAEKGKFFPTTTLNLLADQAHNDGGTTGTERELSATVRFNYTIFDGFQRKSAIKRIKEAIGEQEERKRDLLRDLRLDIKTAYNQVQSSQQSIRTTKQEIRANEAQQELNEQNFRLGDVNVIDLIESVERLNQSRLRLYELQFNAYFNAYQLLITAGVMDADFFCESCEVDVAEL